MTTPRLFDSTSVNEEGYAIRFPSGLYANYESRDLMNYYFEEVELSHCRLLSGARVPPVLEAGLGRFCADGKYAWIEVVRVTRTTTTATTVEPSAPGLHIVMAVK